MSLLAPHRLVLATLVVALLAMAVVAQPSVRAASAAPRPQGPPPAGLPLPQLPGIEGADPAVAPHPRPLERDGVLTDRFTAASQSVTYPFQAEAGELSLFELFAAGYARGWEMAATLRVLAPDGHVLAQSTTQGGVQLQSLLSFSAPAPGLYRLELSPSERHFRYALVRHSDYTADGLRRPLEVGGHERVHGWVPQGERALYSVPVRAGEVLALSVEGTRERARVEHHRLLAEHADGGRMAGTRESRGGRERDRPPQLYPYLHLELVGAARPVATSRTFALLPPAQADGVVQVAVRIFPGAMAALFDLVVRRDVPTHAVGGLVVDADDEPLEGLEVRLLLEPDLEPWGRATTDAGGAWSARVPAGDYRVELRRAGVEPAQAASVGVRGAVELNLLWAGG